MVWKTAARENLRLQEMPHKRNSARPMLSIRFSFFLFFAPIQEANANPFCPVLGKFFAIETSVCHAL